MCIFKTKRYFSETLSHQIFEFETRTYQNPMTMPCIEKACKCHFVSGLRPMPSYCWYYIFTVSMPYIYIRSFSCNLCKLNFFCFQVSDIYTSNFCSTSMIDMELGKSVLVVYTPVSSLFNVYIIAIIDGIVV